MSSGTWIPQVDGLRFMAICSVLAFHIFGELQARSGHVLAIQPRYATLARMFSNGDRGVLLFFVISGYILARPFLREYRLQGKPVSLGAYYLRRVTRLEPPYILSLLLYTIGFWASGLPLLPMLPHLAASMVYLHSLLYHSVSTINFVTWSLEMEVQFYLIAPALGLVYLLRNTVSRRSLMLAIIVASGFFSLFANARPAEDWRWTIFNNLEYFMMGFLLADIVEGHQTQPYRSILWDVVSLLGWPAVLLLPRTNQTLSWLPFLILPIYLAAFYGPASNWFFRRPFVALGGGMCYSIYLMHMLILSIAFKATRHLAILTDFLANYLVQVATLGTLIAVFSTGYYLLIERPCMDPKWPQKLWHWFAGNRVPDPGCSAP
jgi:peptidoglycan/LPS O-acetylase OafA/YrhL